MTIGSALVAGTPFELVGGTRIHDMARIADWWTEMK